VQLKLEGLSCPACASKIEAKIQEMDPQAVVSFNTGTMTVEDKFIDSAKRIVREIEPHVRVVPLEQGTDDHRQAEDTHAHEHAHSNLNQKLTLAAAAVFFALGFVYKPFFLIGFIIPGFPVIRSAALRILRKDFLDEKFLMSIATIGAVAIGEWAEAAAVMILYALGGYFEDLATEKTRRSVKGLLDLTPDRAVVVEGTSTTVKNPEDVKVGEVILVKPGERVPIDGIIVEGATSLNTSALTGESLPKAAEPGDFVMSGVINISSPIKLKVENTYSDSTVAKMLRLLDGAANSKAPAERFISRFARVYTPIVVLISALTAFVPPLLGLGSFSTWGYRALVLLVVSCPCALVISVPLSYFSGMGRASQLGLLVKSGEVLDRLKDVDTAVWDKTGTLTSGDFEVVAVRPENGVNEAELLALAASVEQYFTHPLAAAITKKAKEGGIKLMEAQDLEEIPGKGVTGTVSGQKVFAGSLGYLRSMFPQLSLDNQTSATAVGVVTAGSSPELLGILELTDALKPSTKSAISSLKNLGLANIVLTGDRKSSADSALTGLDLDAVEAELLPEDKLKYVDMLKQTKKPMFIGDGVNDVPVLASAYVGVAMGGIGSDAAIEVSDVILVTDEPKKVPLLIKLARAVQGKVAVNIGLALGIKLLVIALSIFGLSGMWQAIVADVGVTLVAILNAASLFTKFKNA